MPSFHIILPAEGPGMVSYCLANAHPERQHVMVYALVPCYSSGRSELSSKLLASIWSTVGCCGHFGSTLAHRMSLSLFPFKLNESDSLKNGINESVIFFIKDVYCYLKVRATERDE